MPAHIQEILVSEPVYDVAARSYTPYFQVPKVQLGYYLHSVMQAESEIKKIRLANMNISCLGAVILNCSVLLAQRIVSLNS